MSSIAAAIRQDRPFASPGECPSLAPGDSAVARFLSPETGVHRFKIKVMSERRWNGMKPARQRAWTAYRVAPGLVCCFRMIR